MFMYYAYESDTTSQCEYVLLTINTEKKMVKYVTENNECQWLITTMVVIVTAGIAKLC